ncbi:hypothetical protein HUG15_21130 [Salicibibacter cibarius]|uniref:Uncharacterized protein n=1 Tax=Salicibibacter cibarius TaxID=2743000 RepID=A0A7T6Z6Z6_9BACI|nr:hypothetical protein [Salicibibacter cibarius]QQK77832.1 hypothetical protein HUG15_21130 [Salicibibacter cibarius]
MIVEETLDQEALFDEQSKSKRGLKTGSKAKPKEKRARVPDKIADIFPIGDMTDDGAFVLQGDRGYADMFQVRSKDVYAQSDQETEFDILALTQFLRAFDADIKIVSLNFPVNMAVQISHLQKKIDANDSPLIDHFLQKKKAELEFLEKHRTNREFYLYVYGETVKDLTERCQFARRKLQRTIPMENLETTKKLDVIYKLNNQNSKLDHQRG